MESRLAKSLWELGLKTKKAIKYIFLASMPKIKCNTKLMLKGGCIVFVKHIATLHETHITMISIYQYHNRSLPVVYTIEI